MVQGLHLNADISFSHNCLPDVFSVNLLCKHCMHQVTHFISMVLMWRQPEARSSAGRWSVCSASSHQQQHFTALV